MQRVELFLRENRERHLGELNDFLRIPSMSTLPQHRDDIRRAARWVADQLRYIGMTGVEIVPTEGHPIVIGERIEDPALPTALVYGHYDVQPVDPEHLWETPPFEPSVRDGRLYARGASDDKGQVFAHLKAIEAFMQVDGRLPVNVRFLIEGEEEIGSGNLPALLKSRPELRPDIVIISDTHMPGPDLPAICYGLRGIAALEIDLTGANSDLHSGLYGGTVPNPLHVMARLIASLHDDQGRVAVAGFYDAVRELSAEERGRLAAVPFDETAYKASLGLQALEGEAGYSPPERVGIRPSLDVNGMWGGFQGEGSKTVIPAQAHAKITCRLVPDQDPDQVLGLLEHHLREHCPPSVTLTMRRGHGGAPWVCDPSHPAIQAGLWALQQGFGTEAHLIRVGGSIPIVEMFARLWKAPVVLMGFGLPDDGVHAPNESFHLDQLDKGIRTLCHFWRALGGSVL